MATSIHAREDGPDDPGRRAALRWLPAILLGGALTAAYGTFAAFIGRFLFPAKAAARSWLFVGEVHGMAAGDTLVYRLPNGSPVNVTRRGSSGEREDFIALSSTCPHLGCQVHWEPQNDRFFCPCHNGIFTPEGKGIGGPPGDAGQSLPEYPLKVASGLLYIQVPMEVATLGSGSIEEPRPCRGAGHDPCLRSLPPSPLHPLDRGRSA